MATSFVVWEKSAAEVRPLTVIWGTLATGLNDGTALDTGDLQGETVSSDVWTVAEGLTQDSEDNAAVTVKGVTYASNTVSTIWLSGGTAGAEYSVKVAMVTSGSRTIEKTITVRILPQ